MIEPAIRTEILERLRRLEAEESIRILYAVESGSRAWGFPSKDSDYDVRFIYLRPRDWYLSFRLEQKPDTIERPIVDEIDCSGWDIRKTLQLFVKSNPPLLEWLDSSIIYQNRMNFAQKLRALRTEFFSPPACAYHYLHMAQGNFRSYLQGETVRLKKYFYVLRPLLAVKWIEQHRGVVPMLFRDLLATVVDQPALIASIDALIHRKMQGDELDEGPPIPVIKEFIDAEMERLAGWKPDAFRGKVDYEKLDLLFREMLEV
jgi:uncharacterized protein